MDRATGQAVRARMDQAHETLKEAEVLCGPSLSGILLECTCSDIELPIANPFPR
jgi:hypothetical protein